MKPHSLRNFYHVKTLDGTGRLIFTQPYMSWANALNDAEDQLRAPTVYIMFNNEMKALYRHGKEVTLPAM